VFSINTLFVSEYNVSRVSSRCSRVVGTRCHASFARVGRAVLRVVTHRVHASRVLFTRVAYNHLFNLTTIRIED
jgi:hypothetical protein